MIREAIARLVEGADLTQPEAALVMEEIMNGQATDAQIGSFLTALRIKGETTDEIAAFARVMRECARKVNPKVSGVLVDTCGTGGDSMSTFNISTAAAFVAAGCGVPVVKHGNRSVSSRCGSADVLEALGINPETGPERASEILEKCSIVFLFAPLYHPAMRHAAGPRKELGIRTVFNMLGPLANPAGAKAQLVGVYHPGLTEKIAHVLSSLGLERAMVVHGSGLDEISTTGPTRVSELAAGTVRTYLLRCQDVGIRPASLEELKGGDAAVNAQILRNVFSGTRGPARDIVLMNAGAAVYLGGKAGTIEDGIAKSEESIDSGRANTVLDNLIKETGGVP